MSIATTPRNLIAIFIRSIFDSFFVRWQRLCGLFSTSPDWLRLSIYPTIKTKSSLVDVLNRLAWYLPNQNIEIDILCDPALAKEFFSSDYMETPRGQYGYSSSIPKNINLLVKSNYQPKLNPIIIWKWPYIFRFLTKANRSFIVDPYYFSTTESITWGSLYYKSLSKQKKNSFCEISKNNYKRMLAKYSNTDTAYIFTTGPSIDKADKIQYKKNSLKIICNSMVKNRRLLDYLKPDILVFVDPVFHFGPSAYAHEFRKQMLEAIADYKCYCIVPETYTGLLLEHYPELKSYLIGMPIKKNIGWNFPTEKNFYVQTTKNIMTLFMVPIASAISSKVNIIGADGRSPGENYFWKHSKQNQFDDLMETVFNTHPSFFRDRIYDSYYKEHCAIVDRQVIYGEGKGITYNSLTPSQIPALRIRGRNIDSEIS